MKTTIIQTALFALLLPLGARADFAYVCGQGREQGPAHAEVALVDELEGSKFFLAGRELDADDYAVKPDRGEWMVTVFGERGQSDRKFTFREAAGNVQEYSLDSRRRAKKVGEPKPCVHTESALEDDAN